MVQPKVRRKARARVTGCTPTPAASSAREGRAATSAWSRSLASPSHGAIPFGRLSLRLRDTAASSSRISPSTARGAASSAWRNSWYTRRARAAGRPPWKETLSSSTGAWVRMAEARSGSASTSSPRVSP